MIPAHRHTRGKKPHMTTWFGSYFGEKIAGAGLIVLKEDDIQMRFNSCGGDGARNATDSSVVCSACNEACRMQC